jgi:F0F1-type ATP synthase assembly protein I
VENKTSKKSTANSYGFYSSIAFQLVLTVVIGTWIGKKLDEYFQNTSPIITVIFALISTTGGLYIFFKRVLNK